MKILVVEDEPFNMMLMKIILKKHGHEPKEAFNGLIQKPINPLTIMDEIKKILGQHDCGGGNWGDEKEFM